MPTLMISPCVVFAAVVVTLASPKVSLIANSSACMNGNESVPS